MENSFKEIVNLIRRQKNKSTDLMNIPVFIYKILAPIISPTVSILFNNSVSEGIFPECFKTAKIIPIFKSGDSNSTVNYRPISMLPFLSKTFEKLMSARLDSYQNQIIFYVQISLASAKILILQMQLLNTLTIVIHRYTASRAPLLYI